MPNMDQNNSYDTQLDPKLEWRTPHLTTLSLDETLSGGKTPGGEGAFSGLAS